MNYEEILTLSVKTTKEIDLSSLSLSELKLISKVRKIKNYEDMSKDELLSAFKKSEPFKDIKEISKKNIDENKLIRDLRTLYEPEEENYYKPQKLKGAFDDEYIEYESNGDRDQKFSIEEFLNMTRPYLSSVIDDHKDERKIQLAMEISFVSTVKDSNTDFNKKSNKDSNESDPIHIHSENSLVFIGYETVNIIKELFKSLLEE